jgi:hypothetical protein
MCIVPGWFALVWPGAPEPFGDMTPFPGVGPDLQFLTSYSLVPGAVAPQLMLASLSGRALHALS